MPVQSIQMDQLEPITNKLDSSMHMGMMGPGVNGPSLQQISMPNIEMGIMKLSVPNMQMEQMDQRACNLVPEQFLLPNKQLGGMEKMLNNVESQQSSMSIKRKAPMEPTSSTPELQKSSVPNKRVVHMEHRPWLPQVSSPNKLPVQMQSQSTSNPSSSQHSQAQLKRSASTKAGAQQLSVQKNQSGQSSLKFQNESSESVRSKLRESLAAALALVSQERDRSSSVGKHSQNARTQENSQPSGRTSNAADAVNHMSEENKESLLAKEDTLAEKCNDGQNSSKEFLSNKTGDCIQASKSDGQNCQSTIILRDEDISFSDSFFVKDELLQGNGLSWVLESDMGVAEKKEAETVQNQPLLDDSCRISGGQAIHSPKIVASKIEAELYKLFGGVNKKYKEKGRSLLFNLKDRNNPELRERVMSGEIAPEQLCSMTAEELASEELSQWRMAKAEELAQMVVLPDSDVDMRRLVKKTHKGEFQVEVEPQDIISVEVAVGASSLTRTQLKPKEKETSSSSRPNKKKEKGNVTSEKNSLEDQSVLIIPFSEGTDLMQGLMVDDKLKDAEFLPPIVSLDKFMESLNSVPHFENLPEDTGKATSVSDEDDSQVRSESKSPDATSRYPDDANSGKPGTVDLASTKLDADGKYADEHVKPGRTGGIPKGDRVWEGMIQLNISTSVSVIGFYRSGEKATAKGWPGLVEIKGRVKLDAFEKFLQELLMSRSRAVMAVHFICKEGSSESERANLIEVVDSYVMDGRVGLAEPAPGVELYCCPPHSKTSEMLGKVLPKDQLDALNAIDNGLIGVIVWRKPHKTSTSIPNSASHHKHNSKKQHLIPRRHQEKNSNLNVNITFRQSFPDGHCTLNKPQLDEDNDDDVPPGFGPPAGATREEDDLPEFNFSSDSVIPRPQLPNQSAIRDHGMTAFRQNSQNLHRPADQMRELVHRYGQPQIGVSSGGWQDERVVGVMGQPWNDDDDDDDDDDMPEWHPDDAKPQPQPLHMHNNSIQQSILRPPMLQMVPQAQALPLQPQMNVMQPPQKATPSWQQGQWMVPNSGSHGLPAYQPNSGRQFFGAHGLEAGLQGMAWRRSYK